MRLNLRDFTLDKRRCISRHVHQTSPVSARAVTNAVQNSRSFEVLDLISRWKLGRSEQEHARPEDRRQGLTNDEIDLLYEDLEETFYSRRGYIIPKKERLMIDSSGGSAVYGEVLGDGIDKIVEKLELSPVDTFVDLGSGLGRAVFQVALRSPVGRSIGIELSETRQQQAQWMKDKLSETYQKEISRVELKTEDITTCNLEGGSHFLLLSTAFSASGVRMIVERLSRTESFQVLVTSRPIPPTPLIIKVGEFGCSYSWNLKGTAHVYCKPNAPPSAMAAFYCCEGLAYLPSNRPWAVPIAAEDVL